MELDKNSAFYIKARKLLEEYVSNGGKIEDIKADDKLYKYIKNSKVYDENGKIIDLETKFSLLGYPRDKKYTSDVRSELIKEINEYLSKGGSFHIDRKKLPFADRLHTYSSFLKRKGIYMTHEQIMKEDLGFKEYSDTYFRCKVLSKIKSFRNEEGYVDSYRYDDKFEAFVKDLAITYDVPYYIVVTLLADEKLTSYEVSLDRVKYTQKMLENYAKTHKTFVGLKRSDSKLYNALDSLSKYYSDGNPERFSKQEWLEIFDLGDIENRFTDVEFIDYDIEDIMTKLKKKYGDNKILAKDLNRNEYRLVIKKAISLNVPVSEVFKMYGLNYTGNVRSRLSRVVVKNVPYMKEMLKRREELIRSSGIDMETCCKEELCELKVKIMQQIYAEFKEKIESYVPEDLVNIDLRVEATI